VFLKGAPVPESVTRGVPQSTPESSIPKPLISPRPIRSDPTPPIYAANRGLVNNPG